VESAAGYLGQSRLTMANEDEVLAVTGYPIGAVSPFGTKRTMRVLVDPGVFVEEEISIGSGVRGTTVILKSTDLRRAMGEIEIVPLLENPA
jgi:Cys-tRNA(Pro)/Cys-tRNA(Cys) deacylase